MFGEQKISGSLIGFLREATWTLRTIASVVILTFGGLVTAPAVAAVKQEVQQIQRHKAEEGSGAQFTAGMKSVKEHLTATLKAPKGTSLMDMRRQLNADAMELAKSDKETLDGFAATRAMIKDKHLPDVIMQRELAAELHYNTEMAALKQGLNGIITENDDAKAQAKSKDVLDRLAKFQDERKPQKFDPKNLPNRSLKPDLSRVPHTTKKEFAEAGFISNPYLKVATTASNFDYSQLPGASDPAYLAATTEVTLSDAIKAKATELHNNPVEIYNWVRNNVQWQPTWGAVQDADLTLSAQRGNAFDISSLLIALLRASGIPARYIHGTINVPEAKFRNWVGGFQNINAAVNFVSAGGIPVKSLFSGGKIVTVQMEHIWVEAAIDYIPSRGVVNKSADTWVPMDASYKQYTYIRGLDVNAIAGVNPQQVNAALAGTATFDSQGNWMSSFNMAVLQQAQTTEAQALKTYIVQNLAAPTPLQILGGAQIVGQGATALSVGLPHNVVTIGARYGALPRQLEQTITFALGEDSLGEPQNPTTVPWSQLNGKQVILSFDPATATDAAVIASFAPSGPISDPGQLPSALPAYLISVVPTLKVDGQVIMSGVPLTLGQDLIFVFSPSFAGRQTIDNTYNVIAGSYLDVAVIAGTVSRNELEDVQASAQKAETTLQSEDPSKIGTLTREQFLGIIFESGMLGYYTQYDAISSEIGANQGGHNYLAAGIGTFGFEPKVAYAFGVPTAVSDGFAVMNAPIVNITGFDGSDSNARLNYILQIGILSSALENTVSEQIFSTPADSVTAISAVKALEIANSEGQKIYHITQSNESSVLPALQLSESAVSDIENGLSAGNEVITHAANVSISGWTGSGYVIYDPVSGSGAYKINGGANGSSVTIPDHSTKMFFAIAALVIGVTLAFLINPLFGFVLLMGAIVDYTALLHQIYNAKSPADNADINVSLNVMISMAIMGAAPLWEAAAGIGLILWSYAAWMATIVGAFFAYF